MAKAKKLSDKDVIALVRKEFERKLKQFCVTHGFDAGEDEEPGDKEKKEDKAEDNTDANDSGGNDDRGDRVHADKAKKPKNIEADDLAPGIRVKHRDSQLVYTVIGLHLGSGQVELETPEGNTFSLPADEIESEYTLD